MLGSRFASSTLRLRVASTITETTKSTLPQRFAHLSKLPLISFVGKILPVSSSPIFFFVACIDGTTTDLLRDGRSTMHSKTSTAYTSHIEFTEMVIQLFLLPYPKLASSTSIKWKIHELHASLELIIFTYHFILCTTVNHPPPSNIMTQLPFFVSFSELI